MRKLVVAVLTATALVAGASVALAHPLGNFTVNRAVAVTLTPGRAEVTYVLDLAEVPTVQARPGLDTDADGTVAQAELDSWAAAQGAAIVPALDLRMDDTSMPLEIALAQAWLTPGQAGLDVLRLEIVAVAEGLPDRGTITFTDTTDDDRLGWREVTAAGADGVVLEGSDVPSASPSEGLRRYPTDAAERPLDVRSMRASFAPGISIAGAAPGVAPSVPGLIGGERLVAALGKGGVGVLVAGFALALVLGAWHALMPGHGKTLMAGAVVGSGAGRRQTVVVALAVAAMHTASVLVLGAGVLALEATFRPETLYPWLTVASGLAAVAIGGMLVRRRWRAWRHTRSHAAGGHHHHHDHDHALPLTDDGRLGVRGMGALAFAGGIVPAPSALLVLLAAIQLHRTAAGVAMVGIFSLGLAVSLLAIGLGAVKARDLVERRGRGIAIAVPLAAAAITVVAGLVVIAGGAARL